MEQQNAKKHSAAGEAPVHGSSRGLSGLYEFDFEDINTDDAWQQTEEDKDIEITDVNGDIVEPEEETYTDPFDAAFEESDEKRRKRLLSFRRKSRKGWNVSVGFFTWVKDLAIALAIVWVVLTFLAGFETVKDTDMDPTIAVGEHLLVIKFSYRWVKPARGEVVCIKDPSDNSIHFSRIVGLPGDKIVINSDGYIYVNDVLLETSYCEEGKTAYIPGQLSYPYRLPDGQYFVLCDNPSASWDSRYRSVSGVALEEIVGKVFGCYWPQDAWRPIH